MREFSGAIDIFREVYFAGIVRKRRARPSALFPIRPKSLLHAIYVIDKIRKIFCNKKTFVASRFLEFLRHAIERTLVTQRRGALRTVFDSVNLPDN